MPLSCATWFTDSAVAEDTAPISKVDLVLLDQLVRLLRGKAGVGVVVFDDQLDLAAEDAAFCVDFGERHPARRAPRFRPPRHRCR